MIRGIGIDIADIAELEEALLRHNGRLHARLFTPEELVYCAGKPRPGVHLAARFAAKEAFSKAVGTGIARGLGWKDVAVASRSTGEPELVLSARAVALLEAKGAGRALVSLTHSRTSAAAVVVLE